MQVREKPELDGNADCVIAGSFSKGFGLLRLHCLPICFAKGIYAASILNDLAYLEFLFIFWKNFAKISCLDSASLICTFPYSFMQHYPISNWYILYYEKSLDYFLGAEYMPFASPAFDQ